MRDIFEVLEISKKVNYIGQKITKKIFYQHANFNRDEEKIFRDVIDKIEMSYVLDSSNINIDIFVNEQYNYTAIGYMKIILKKEYDIDKIANIIQSSIPNPLIIIFIYNDKISISSSLKRINKNDNSKVIVEDINTTPWIVLDNMDYNTDKFIKSISIDNLDYINFYNFYKSINNRIYIFKNLEVIGEYSDGYNQNIEEIRHIIERINIYNEQLKKIITDIKKESQFNKKMELNIKATNINKKIEYLRDRVK